LYHDNDGDDYSFAGLINHSLAIQHAEQVTSGVDPALEQLKSSMAAISEMKEANKYGLSFHSTPIRVQSRWAGGVISGQFNKFTCKP
jgi:RNA polymerase II elongation factor ELL